MPATAAMPAPLRKALRSSSEDFAGLVTAAPSIALVTLERLQLFPLFPAARIDLGQIRRAGLVKKVKNSGAGAS
jgi:hypothetical protein